MKLVYGDQVIENANVTVQTQTKPERLKKLIELTVPADVSNGGYAVSQLLDRDPDIGAKSVVTLEVALTQQQISRLEKITEDELRDIRNGVNPAMIFGVRVYDSEPIDVEEFIVKGLRNEGVGKNEQQVFPKWFVPQFDQQDTIGNKTICIRRDSETGSEMFCEGGRSYLSDVWDGHSMDLKEITEEDAKLLLNKEPESKGFPQWFTPSHTLKDATGKEIICFRRYSEHSGETYCVGGISYLFHEWKGDGLQLEEITEPEAQAIIAHSVKPTGEWLGCVQWFQHGEPGVVVRRDSPTLCTYYEPGKMPMPGRTWHQTFSQWIKEGAWKEITQEDALSRLRNMNSVADKVATCKREQFAGGGAPSPRNCDVCLEGPCPRVIPVQTEDTDSAAMQALRKLAQQRGIDPAGMASQAIADALIAANQRIAAETSNLQQTVERSFEQLPANREMVIRAIDLAAAKDDQMLEYPVDQIACPRGGIDELLWPEVDTWVPVLPENKWEPKIWAARRNELKIRCLPQHLPPVRNAAEPKPIPRNIPNLAFVGIDWAKRRDVAATQHVNTLPFSLGDGPLQLQLRNDFDQEGVWLYVVAGDLRLALVTQDGIDAGKYSFPISCPCIHLCSYPRVKWPVEYRNAAMPKDYGKEVMYFGDFGPEWGRGILRGLRSTGTGREDLIVEIPTETMNGLRTETIDSRRVFVIDAPTEGF